VSLIESGSLTLRRLYRVIASRREGYGAGVDGLAAWADAIRCARPSRYRLVTPAAAQSDRADPVRQRGELQC